MTRLALGTLAIATAIVGFGARSFAQPAPNANPRPTPSPTPTPQARTMTASPVLTTVGSRVSFFYAPLAARATTVTIAYGDGTTGTLTRSSFAAGASVSATGTHAYARASGSAGFRACVPATTTASYVAAVAAPICVNVYVLAPTPSPIAASPRPSAIPSASATPHTPTPAPLPSPVPTQSRLPSQTPVPVTPTPSPRATASPPPPPLSTPTPTPTPTPTFARSATPIAIAPTASPRVVAAAPAYPITGWTLSWANGLYAVDVPRDGSIPPAIAQVTVGSAKRIIGQWIVDGIPAATQTHTQTVPGDVVTFEYDFPTQAVAPRDTSIHRIVFQLLDPISSAPAGAPTAPPSIAYRYAIAPGSYAPGGNVPTLDGPVAPGAIAALQFDGFLATVAHLTVDPAGTYSGDGTAHVADLAFPVHFSGLIVGNVHASTLGVTSDVTGGTATTTAAAACQRVAGSAANADAAFASELGAFHRFSYAFSLMSATLEPLGAHSKATLCYAPASVQLGAAARDGFNFGSAADAPFGDASSRALALGLGNVPIDESGAFAFDLPGDRVPSWRVGSSTFSTVPTASVPYRFAFANDAAAPHVTCDGTPATGALLQQLYDERVQAIATQCAWSPTGVDATVTLAAGTALTTSEPYRFKLVIDASALSIANSTFVGGHVHGTFFANRSATATTPASATAAASAPADADTFNTNQRAKSAAAFVPDDVGSAQSASDPTGTFDGTLSKSGDLIADAVPADWTTSAYAVASTHATLFAAGGQTSHPTKDENVGKTWADIVRSLTIGQTPAGATAFALPGLFVATGTLDRAPAAAVPFDATASGAAFGLVFVDGTTTIVTSAAATVAHGAVALVGPKPSVTVVPGTTTLEVRWPAAPGYRGYALLRRDPAGNVITLDPLVRAFAYRDGLATGAHGDFAYALRVVTVRGLGPAGPFTSATLSR